MHNRIYNGSRKHSFSHETLDGFQIITGRPDDQWYCSGERHKVELQIIDAAVRGKSADDVLNFINSEETEKCLDLLLSYGVNPEAIGEHMEKEALAFYFDLLVEKGANDRQLLSLFSEDEIIENINDLLQRCHPDTLVARISGEKLSFIWNEALKYGADLKLIMERIDTWGLFELFSSLITSKFFDETSPQEKEIISLYEGRIIRQIKETSAKDLVGIISPADIIIYFERLREKGLNPEAMVKEINREEEAGEDLFVRLSEEEIKSRIKVMTDYGVNIYAFFESMDPILIIRHAETLLQHGVRADDVINRISEKQVSIILEILLRYGADIDALLDIMQSEDISNQVQTLLEYGADVNLLADCMKVKDVIRNADIMIKHGLDVDRLTKGMTKKQIEKIWNLKKSGADLRAF